jgi:hypothetical protein
MELLSTIISKLTDLVLLPASWGGQAYGLAWLSILAGVGMAYVFKYTSNQEKIRLAKDRFKSYILEMRIYQDDFLAILRALSGALKSNLKYLGYTLKPLFIMIIPVIIVFMQMDERYGRKPLSPGETTILSVVLDEGIDPLGANVSLECSPGASIDAGPVRITELGEIDWRLKILSAGTHSITIDVDGEKYEIPVTAERPHRFIGASRSSSSLIEPLLHPGLPPIPSDSHIAAVHLEYPGVSYPFLFWHTHWLVIFIIYSLIGALAVKLIVGFEI